MYNTVSLSNTVNAVPCEHLSQAQHSNYFVEEWLSPSLSMISKAITAAQVHFSTSFSQQQGI